MQKCLLNNFKHFFPHLFRWSFNTFLPRVQTKHHIWKSNLKNKPEKKVWKENLFQQLQQKYKKAFTLSPQIMGWGRRRSVLCVRERGVGFWVSGFYVLERPRLSRSLTCRNKTGYHQWKLRWFEGQQWLKMHRWVQVYLVYPDEPVLCSICFLQHIQLKVLVANLSVTNSVVTRRTLWKER